MVEASEDDTVVDEGGVEEGGVEEGGVEEGGVKEGGVKGGVVGGVERVGDDDVAGAGTGEVSKDGDISRGCGV